MEYRKLRITLNIVLVLSLLMLAAGTYYGMNKWEEIERSKDV